MTSFAAKILKQTALIYDMRWQDVSGEMVYAIFEAEKSKNEAFLKILDSDDMFDLSDYGTVLHKGFGEPDQSLKDELNTKYGLYED